MHHKTGCVIATAVASTLLLWASPARAQQEKFSLSMFHFNVQYVAGGLEGFPDGESNDPDYDLDDAAVQDMIIVESFEPILDLLLAHPTWKLTLEMQGYMVEIMQQRHPVILDKLKQLTDDGQVELVSFHYSDQLFLGYPRLDMERSHELLDRSIEDAGLTLSPVIFCQEGQFGEGVAPIAAEHGQTILGLPKNLFRYQHLARYDTSPPLYELDGSDVVIIGRGFDASEIAVSWSFYDDGELLATGGMAPYFPQMFTIDASAIAEYEQELMDAEANGWRIATISEMVQYVKDNDLGSEPLPPLLDGTWQPPSTESMFQWMGRSGALDGILQCERDNEVLSGNARARDQVMAAETLLAWARLEGYVVDGEFPGGLDECWRLALLGQVTDSSGINPFINEIEYGKAHASQATDCATAISTDLAHRVGSAVLEVDSITGEVTRHDSLPAEDVTAVDPRLTEADGFTIDHPARDVEELWEQVGSSGDLHRVTLSFTAARNGSRFIEVTFPWEPDELRLTPGLIEDEVRTYPMSAFDFMEGRITLPVANGLIGLRDDLWLIKDTRYIHVGARFTVGEPLVRFQNETTGPETPATWRFYLFEGTTADALRHAERINLRRTVYIMGPQPAGDDGCGCQSTTPTRGALPWLLVALFFLLRRRVR